jgi:hypothetical protein
VCEGEGEDDVSVTVCGLIEREVACGGEDE